MNSPVNEIKNEKRLLLKKHLDRQIEENGILFNQNKDAILTLDLDGQILRVNPAFIKLSGYSVEESLEMKLAMIFPIESLDKVYHFFIKASLGEVQNFDCQMTTKNGQIVELNMTNIPIGVHNKIVGVYAVARDITQLKKKKAEVRKIEDFHRVLTDNILDLILTTNLLGQILYATPSCEHILGFKSEELIGHHFSEFLYKEDLEKAIYNRERLLTNLEYTRDSYLFRKKDGSLIWMEAIGQPIIDPDTKNILEIVSVIRDITELKLAEEDLWRRKRAFRNLVEHSPDAIIIAKNEKILFINETGIKLLGGTEIEDVLSNSLLDFIHPAYHADAKVRIKSVIGGNTTELKQYKIVRLDGTEFDAEMMGIPTFFQNQVAQYVIIRDITERKKTQELILKSEKLTVAGQLAAGIAHEVRNPLTAIKGFLQLMEAEFKYKSYFEIIQSEMDRIDQILNELLVLAKPQDVKFEKENIHNLVEDIKTLIDTQAVMNNILIKVVNDCKNSTITCDKNQLKQVFINFLKNAIEAMPKGGEITIELKQHGKEKVKIIFKDTGTGIPRHILKRIGEPFFTTKENGTGLGIMISKQIIENHKGSVNFWSDEKGTIIEVILPVVGARPPLL